MGSQLAQRRQRNKVAGAPIILGRISAGRGDGAGAQNGSGGPGTAGATGRRPDKLFTCSILEHVSVWTRANLDVVRSSEVSGARPFSRLGSVSRHRYLE